MIYDSSDSAISLLMPRNASHVRRGKSCGLSLATFSRLLMGSDGERPGTAATANDTWNDTWGCRISVTCGSDVAGDFSTLRPSRWRRSNLSSLVEQFFVLELHSMFFSTGVTPGRPKCQVPPRQFSDVYVAFDACQCDVCAVPSLKARNGVIRGESQERCILFLDFSLLL